MLTRSLLVCTQYYPEGKANGKSIVQLMSKGDPDLLMDEKKEWLAWKREDNIMKGEAIGKTLM